MQFVFVFGKPQISLSLDPLGPSWFWREKRRHVKGQVQLRAGGCSFLNAWCLYLNDNVSIFTAQTQNGSLCLNIREETFSKEAALRRQIRGEVFSILSSLADLSNAIHWMPPGFLWAGRFPPWLVGLMGTTSSLIGLLKMSSGDQGACS